MKHFVRLGTGDVITTAGATDDAAFAVMQVAEGRALVEVPGNFMPHVGKVYSRDTGEVWTPPPGLEEPLQPAEPIWPPPQPLGSA